MKELHIQSCEVKVDGAWRLVSLQEALKHHQFDTKRCPSCHGRLIVYNPYRPMQRPYIAHHRVHTGCPSKLDTYSGTPSPHPQAIP
jgi:hypothetical protein